MTAIFGLWNLNGAPGAGHASADMQRALAIYGADRVAIEEEGPVALGVTLARLVPEDRFDRQPLAGGGGRWLLVADVRLDNRPELASALGIAPAELAVMADSDVVLRAWERWEDDTPSRLVGDFALAVWDARERRLVLARDFLGQRPLFYARSGPRLAFATMAKGIHALGDIAPAPDLDRMRDYLALTPIIGTNSFFAGICRLEQGEVVTFEADGRESRRIFYDWDGHRPIRHARDADYVEEFRAIFDRAVADRLRSTGSVASQLSSGNDSSAVTATAAQQLAATGKRLTAYTHVPLAGAELDEPPGRMGDEWPIAHEIASLHPNIEHVAVDAADRGIGDDLESQFHYFEYPALNLCNCVWTREISRLAARGRHKVLLTGAVGNATISLTGGERRAELFLSGQWLAWAREGLLAHNYALSPWEYTRATLGAVLPRRVVGALKRLSGRRTDQLPDFSALRVDIRDSAPFRAHLRDIGFDPSFPGFRSVRDLSTAILRRIDLLGVENKGQLAAFGVDGRDPTADQRLVEFVRNVPSHVFLRNGQTRWIYKQAFAGRLPPVVFSQRLKGYQAADWRPRMRKALPRIGEELALSRSVAAVDALVDRPLLDQAVGQGLPEGPPTQEQMETYRLRLLRAVSVVHFLRKLDKRNRPAELAGG